MNTSIIEFKEEIAYFMRRLYTQGLTTTSGGNISVRFDESTVLITPSASDKGRMKAGDIGVMDMHCEIIGEKFKPSIESRMHTEIYKARPDVFAIVHAHPVHASALAAGRAKINNKFLAESYAILGNIEYADYRLMGTAELANVVAESAKKSNCIIMRNHGALAAGRSLLEAFDRLEVLEAAARIAVINGGVMKDFALELNDKQCLELDKLMNRA